MIFQKERGNLKKILTLEILLLITIALLPISISPVRANPKATLRLVPDRIVDPSITPGSIVVINVSVVNVEYFYSWQVKILFNPAVLNCTNVEIPPNHIFAGRTFATVTPIIDNIRGYIKHTATLVGDQYVNGSGILCKITFKVIGKGVSNINFSRPYGGETFLWDYNLELIDADIIDGYFANAAPPTAYFDFSPRSPVVNEEITFNASKSYDPDGTIVSYNWSFGDGGTATGQIATHKYSSPGTYIVSLKVTDNDGLTDMETKEITVYEYKPARLYVNPPEIADPTLLPPSIVKINITLEGVRDMYGYEFKLEYNTEMLTCIGAIVHIVQNQTNFSPIILINDPAGFIYVNVTYYPPSTPMTIAQPENLVTIYFLISGMGYSQLHLSDTEIIDVYGNSISHQTEDGFIITLIRDVAVMDVVPSSFWAYQNWTIKISVTVKNIGNLSESFNVRVYYNDTLMATRPIINLPPGTTSTITIDWNTTGVDEGIYIIKAEVSIVPYEYNVENNVLFAGPIVIFTKIRDVAVNSISLSRNWAFPGMAISIIVSVENRGEFSESFDVRVYYNNTLMAAQSVSELPAGTQLDISFTWNTSGLHSCNNYVIKAEVPYVQYEYNLTNNFLVDGIVKIRVLGDLDGDGVVDGKDISIISRAFGSYPGHPRWNPDADITGSQYLVPDEFVDAKDLALVCRNYGRTC
ncbi:MAG: PKD domain-containing protein [Candidatus Bathyarchaeia archaeon]